MHPNDKIELPVYDTKLFSWHSDTRVFAGEASDLRWSPGSVPLSIKLQSQTTGRVKEYRYLNTEYYGKGSDREVLCWWYGNDDTKTRVQIYND